MMLCRASTLSIILPLLLLLIAAPGRCDRPRVSLIHDLSERASPPRSRPTSPTTGLLSDVVKHHTRTSATASSGSQASHSAAHQAAAATQSHSTATRAASSSSSVKGLSPHSAQVAATLAKGRYHPADYKPGRRGRAPGTKTKAQEPNAPHSQSKPYADPRLTLNRPGSRIQRSAGASPRYEYDKARRERAKASLGGAGASHTTSASHTAGASHSTPASHSASAGHTASATHSTSTSHSAGPAHSRS